MTESVEDPLVLVEDRDGVALVLLNRPAQRNSLRYESWTQLSSALSATADARAIVIAGAAIALINDLPAMLLGVSRLMFAWAEDGIFPSFVTAVSKRWHTPYIAIVLSSGMASRPRWISWCPITQAISAPHVIR